MTEASRISVCSPARERALDWLTAASPVLLMAFCYYRWAAVWLALLAAAGYLAVAELLQWVGIGRRDTATAVAVGMLTACFLPAAAPLWVAAIAGAAGALWAGLPELLSRWLPAAHPLTSPVPVGVLLVRWAFPARVLAFELPRLWAPLDATPVSTSLLPLWQSEQYPMEHLLFGIREGAVGEACIPILLLAAGYLLIRRRVRLVPSAVMLATVSLLSWAVWGLPWHGLLAGSTVLAALVLADEHYAPVTIGAQCVAGVVAGGVTVLLRATVAADGCVVGVLLACLLTPVYGPFLALMRRVAIWLWRLICRYVPPAAAWLWGLICRYVPPAAAWLDRKSVV